MASSKPNSRAEAPLGAIRERDAGNGKRVRVVKIRMDGPTGLRWIHYARWWWEKNRGPVPSGMRVAHADGELLNDDPSNFKLMTPGEVIKLCHRLDPGMSRRNHAACGRAAAQRNVESGQQRRRTTWLRQQWYGADIQRRMIFNQPRRKRWMVYEDHGFGRRLGERLAVEIEKARQGDRQSACFVLRQARQLSQYWRWMRSASLGWPGISCMSACILHVLAEAGEPRWTCEVLETVTSFRRLAGWNPVSLSPGVLSSCVSAMRDLVQSRRDGPRMTRWWITPAGLAVRVAGPRILPVRGRQLNSAPFSEFTRVEPAAEAVA